MSSEEEEDYDDIISLVVEFMLFLIKFKFVYLGPVHTCFRTGSLEYFPCFIQSVQQVLEWVWFT